MTENLVWSTEALATAWNGRYRIERVLGRGRIATVYLAEDLRHQRRVAIKLLDPALGEIIGAERFLGEIRTAATLQHPHIVPFFDSGEVNGTPYYVMQFVDGETLRDRLTRDRQLPIEQATRLAGEVAAALDYAHRHGVVHRDIKPENILLHDGSALVADFGIALALSSVAGQRLTATGISLGTPQYMSPEQAAGERTIDARSDVFALGAVTYEMLAGEAPFTGPTLHVVLARVATEEPRSLHAQRHSIPANVEAAVRKALEKIPADRFATAKEFGAALSAPGDAHGAASKGRIARRSAAIGIAAAIVLLVAGWYLGRTWERQRAVPYPPSRLAIVGTRIDRAAGGSAQRNLALTPDGGTLLYVAASPDGSSQRVRQSLVADEATPIPNVRKGTAAPFISADGQWFIGWPAGERAAYRYPIGGGAGEPLSLIGGYTDFVEWDRHGTIWFSPRDGGGLWRFAPGDTVARALGQGAGHVRLQQLLPDERHALVMTRSTTSTGPVAVLDLTTAEQTPLMPGAVVEVRYSAGYLIFVLPNGSLQAVPFDAAKRQITGAAVPLATGVSITGTGVAQFAVSANGTLAYIAEEPPALVYVDREGKSQPALDARHTYHAPRFSPDGKSVALDFNSADGRDVWILSVAGGSLSRATFAHDGHDATWTPDGRFITYLSARSGTEAIYEKPPNDPNKDELLFSSAQLGFTGVWLRDGTGLVTAVNDLHPGSGADVALISHGGRGPLEALVATEFTEAFPALSPDSRWLAFASDQTGRYEVYVRPLAGGDQIRVSQEGGTEPAWGPSGNELFYRTLGDSAPQLLSATTRMQPAFTVAGRRVLFSVADVLGTNPHANYDVSPDGKRFVMVRRTPATRIMVIQNLPAFVQRVQSGSDGR